ncbi:MAG: efflux RND transporter periplasmic adaptor subunit [Candidatus Cloacimonetes bacterium]|nr:efflux RND transporter periplasmic adaptor subunit [Candidatus Cloacimonadota bacterium]
MKNMWLFLILATSLYASQTHKTIKANQSSDVKHTNKTSDKAVFTCSMHPQIRAPQQGKCPICFMDLISLDTTNVLPSDTIELNKQQQKNANILTYPVQFKHDQKNLNLYGKVKLIPSNIYRITAWAGGRVDKLFVNSIGQKVKKGDPLYQIYSPALISSQQELISALNLLKNSKKSSSRFLSLTTNLKAIRQKLLYLGLTKKDLQKIENKNAPAPLITVHAQRSGVVKDVTINEGEYVKEGAPILLIANMDTLWVEASVYEDDIQTLHGPIQSLIILDSHPKEEILAQFVRIDPFVNSNTRSSRAIFSISNTTGQYHEGSFARVQVESHSKKGLLIPHSSALFTGQKAVVFVKNKNHFKSVFVRVLEKTQSYYRVLGDLKEGDQVVAQGTFKIDSEFQIQAKDSMMSSKELLSPYGSRIDFRKPIDKAQDWLKLKKPSIDLKQKFDHILDSYIELHLSLSEDSFDESKEIIAELSQSLFNIDQSTLNSHEIQVLKLINSSLKKTLTLASSTKLFKDLRGAFSLLSQWMIALTENHWISQNPDLKKVYCPMAFDNQGAYWVQDEDEVLNPYFGSKMLKCGTIKDWNLQ